MPTDLFQMAGGPSLPQLELQLDSSETPGWPGPRHWGQSLALAGTAKETMERAVERVMRVTVGMFFILDTPLRWGGQGRMSILWLVGNRQITFESSITLKTPDLFAPDHARQFCGCCL